MMKVWESKRKENVMRRIKALTNKRGYGLYIVCVRREDREECKYIYLYT